MCCGRTGILHFYTVCVTALLVTLETLKKSESITVPVDDLLTTCVIDKLLGLVSDMNRNVNFVFFCGLTNRMEAMQSILHQNSCSDSVIGKACEQKLYVQVP